MTRRAGVTLTEVLVAIFISGIGLVSLLVLFPLGALNMNQAIKDQRAADACRIATSIARFWGIRDDSSVSPKYNSAAVTTGPSYPVYVDPQGMMQTTGAVGGTSIQRASVSTWTTPAQVQRWTTLLDEMVFDPNIGSGTPSMAGGVIERTPRYSWAWLCQQVKASTTSPTPAPGVSVTVVVYDRRPLVPGSSTPLQEEIPCTANFKTGTNVVSLSWGGTAPALKRGCWILDATVTPQINGYFYRVVNVTSTGANSAIVELHMNARANGNTAVVMDGVVEVFEKGS